MGGGGGLRAGGPPLCFRKGSRRTLERAGHFGEGRSLWRGPVERGFREGGIVGGFLGGGGGGGEEGGGGWGLLMLPGLVPLPPAGGPAGRPIIRADAGRSPGSGSAGRPGHIFGSEVSVSGGPDGARRGLLRPIASYCVASRLIASYCVALRLIASCCVLLRRVASRCVVLRLVALCVVLPRPRSESDRPGSGTGP